jgi:hypothetical protein
MNSKGPDMSTFSIVHHNDDPLFVFPFPVQRHTMDRLYIEPVWGIRVDAIQVDGQSIASEPFRARLDDLNFNRVPIASDMFVYLVRRHNLVFARRFSEAGEYDLERYAVPAFGARLRIDYRLRESPTSLGPQHTLLSRSA